MTCKIGELVLEITSAEEVYNSEGNKWFSCQVTIETDKSFTEIVEMIESEIKVNNSLEIDGVPMEGYEFVTASRQFTGDSIVLSFRKQV